MFVTIEITQEHDHPEDVIEDVGEFHDLIRGEFEHNIEKGRPPRVGFGGLVFDVVPGSLRVSSNPPA